jgi:4-hydroxybenzoate polyprenyltransferase
MTPLVAFFKLLRPLNLLIIAFTMYAMRWGVLYGLLEKKQYYPSLQCPEWKFALAVLMMVLLAGAGNLINDYFDVRVDRVNKPNRVLVGRQIKRRVVIVAHHALNIIATLTGLYLAYDVHYWPIVFVPIGIAAILWFYSLKLKKEVFTGNFSIALIVAVVPLWAGIFEIPQISQLLHLTGGSEDTLHNEMWIWMVGYSIFAFLLTLLREVFKDMEDIEGDSKEGFQTIPIAWGLKRTKVYIGIIFFAVLAMILNSTYYILSALTSAEWRTIFITMLTIGVIIPLLMSWRVIFKAVEKEGFGKASRLAKLTMAGGILIGALLPYWFH